MAKNFLQTYKSFFYIFFLVLNCSLGGFFFGYKFGEMNLLLVNLQHIYSWSESQTTIYTAILNAMFPFGAVFGALLSGNRLEKYGRRTSLILADLTGIIGSVLCIFTGSHAFPQICGRFISGITNGMNSQLVPQYVHELSPVETNGFMGAIFASFISIGILFSYCMGLNIPDDQADYDVEDIWWKFVFLVPAVTCFIRTFCLLVFYKFDTPFSLIRRGRNHEAQAVVKTIYQEQYVDEVIQNIEMKVLNFKDVSYKELYKIYRPRLVLGIMLMIINQLCGVNAVVAESSELYAFVGNSEEIKIMTVFNSIVLFVASLIAGVISDKFGRRTLLLIGNVVCALFLILIAVFQEFSSTELEEMSIFMTYLFLLSFGVSLGSIVWIYLPEILPDKGISLGVIVNMISAGLVIFFTPIIVENFGVSPLYFFFAAILLGSEIYLYFLLKETKGKTSEEVDEIFGTITKEKETNLSEGNHYAKWNHMK